MRDDLDYDEASDLVEAMRKCVREEWETSFGAGSDLPSVEPEADKALEETSPRTDRKGGWKF